MSSSLFESVVARAVGFTFVMNAGCSSSRAQHQESFRQRLEHSEGLQITVDTMLRAPSQLQREGRCGIELQTGGMPPVHGIAPNMDWGSIGGSHPKDEGG